MKILLVYCFPERKFKSILMKYSQFFMVKYGSNITLGYESDSVLQKNYNYFA